MDLANCWIWARIEYWRRKREWNREGRRRGLEPYLIKRPSRKWPSWVNHYLVGTLDELTDQVRVVSYKPIVSKDGPWWLAWKQVLFHGAPREGDFPSTLQVSCDRCDTRPGWCDSECPFYNASAKDLR